VIKTDVKKNTVIVGEREDTALFGKTISTTGRHRIGKPQKLPTKIIAKIRYRQEPQEATLKENKQKDIVITFKKKQRAIAPGQTIVAYKGDECIGSGIIIG
jgi:tRNA-uridine 2-sulfurtransferase